VGFSLDEGCWDAGRDLLTELQLTLMEPVTNGGDTWPR
jgi:hypothetical protein